MQLGRGKKDPSTVAGAPFPPAVEHSDGPDHPPRDVPTLKLSPSMNLNAPR